MTTIPKIILLGGEGGFQKALAAQLALGDAFLPVTLGAPVPDEAQLERLAEEDPDAVILDIGEAAPEGLDACRRLRAAGIDVPILVLTSARAAHDPVLEAGATAHAAKPLRLNLLLAALRAALQADAQRRQATLAIGPYGFQPAHKLLLETATGRVIRLTEKETAMLRRLAEAAGRILSRETLLEAVWGYNSGVTTHTLETHVYRLRQKIETDPANAVLLITEPGGYRLGLP